MQGNDVTAAFSKMKVEGPSSDAVNHKENSPGKVRYRKVRGVRYSTYWYLPYLGRYVACKSQEPRAKSTRLMYVVT